MPYEEKQVRNESVSVGTSSVLVSSPIINGQRTLFVVSNTSSGGQNITLSVDAYAIAGAGLVLSPGMAWSESADSAFQPTNRPIYAVASAASGSVGIQERLGIWTDRPGY